MESPPRQFEVDLTFWVLVQSVLEKEESIGGSKMAPRSTPFTRAHVIEYGLKITEQEGAVVKSVQCRFCIFFGKEEIPGKKRQRTQTSRVKYWTSPFRPEYYKSHHESQHSQRWEEYQTLSAEKKQNYFSTKTASFIESMHAYFGKSDELKFYIKQELVDVIVGDVFFHPDDHGGISHSRTLSIFKPVESESVQAGYEVVIKNPLQFHLAVDFLAHGLSFRQTAAVLDSTKRLANLGKIGSVSDAKVSNFARVLVAVNLQRIRTILESAEVWGFSIAFDSSNHRGGSYFAQRIRFYRSGDVINLHLLSVPMFERHTAANMFALSVKVLDVVCPSWRDKLLGIGTDGANVMTGRLGGMATLLEKEASFMVHRTWCLLHQIDLIAKDCLSSLFEGEFMTLVNKIAATLRRQENLIMEMQATCPKMTTRWLALGSWTRWQVEKRIPLMEFFSQPRAKVVPPDWYWPVVCAISSLFFTIDISMKRMQAQSLVLSQQSEEIRRLISCIIEMTAVSELGNDAEVECPDDEERCGSWRILHSDLDEFLLDQGLWLKTIIEGLDDEACLKIKQEMGKFICSFVDRIHQICPLRTSENRPLSNDEVPAVMPQQLCRMKGSQFALVLGKYLDRLKLSWTKNEIAQLEDEHSNLREAYRCEPLVAQMLNDLTESSTFADSWKKFTDRYGRLAAFCGALATLFPNNASVESDFSVLGWEKDEYRMSLTDISLEGILQAKQFETLTML